MEQFKKLIATTSIAGDCTQGYDVILDQPYTLNDFLERLVKEEPREWGSIYVLDQLIAKYRYGNITNKIENFEEFKDQFIFSIKSNGGWSKMDYFIKFF